MSRSKHPSSSRVKTTRFRSSRGCPRGSGDRASRRGETGVDPIIAKAREEFQNRLDSTPEGATLRLPRGEHPGPVSITRRLTLDGQGATIWALEGPVV